MRARRALPWHLTLGLSTLLAVAVLAPPAGAQVAGWEIERFDVTITVRDDGSFEVVEDIAVDFRTLSRRGIFRTIPVRYALHEADTPPAGFDRDEVWRTIDLRRVRVQSSGPDDLKVTGPGLTGHTTTIRIGDPDVTISGRQTYRISYEVRGALNTSDGRPQLSWNATGHEWEAPIRAATATIVGPPVVATACFRGPPGSAGLCDDVKEQGGTVRAGAGNLPPGTGLTIVAAFAPGSVAVPPPVIEPRWTLSRGLAGSPYAGALAVLTSLLGLAGVGLLAYRQGRDRVTRGGVSVDGHVDPQPERRRLLSPWPVKVEYRPPDDLRPAQLGLIVDERVEPVEISATIVDLAVRGHLRIVEEETPRFLRRSLTEWRLQRTGESPGELLPYERRLLDALFSDGDEVELSDLQGTFHTDYKKVVSDIYADGVARGWFPTSPETIRTVWFGVGLLALTVAVGLFVAAVRYTTVGVAAVPLILAALVLVVAHRWMPHRTAKGSARLVQTLGFKEFIATAEADRMDFAEQENLFVSYLPYAVVFGAVDKWASAFAHLGAAAAATAAGAGAWYVSSSGRPPDLSRLSGGLSDFSARVGSSLPTAPPSSSGGGGSSGGGMGGGGGGSW